MKKSELYRNAIEVVIMECAAVLRDGVKSNTDFETLALLFSDYTMEKHSEERQGEKPKYEEEK